MTLASPTPNTPISSGVWGQAITDLYNDVYEGDIAALMTAIAAYGHSEGSSGALAIGTQSTSAYANIPGSSAISFTKVAGTRLMIDMTVGCYVTGAGAVAEIGAQVASTDYFAGGFTFSTNLDEHETLTGLVYVSGLAAGAYSIRPRWKRISGSGVLTTYGGDYYTFKITEVA